MKKIISALALGAVAAGFASAELKIGINYRNGTEVFKYVNKGAEGRTTDDYGNVYIDSGYDTAGSTIDVLKQTGWNAGKDNVALTASGEIFTLKATVQPTIGSNNIIWHIFDIGAKVDNFYANAGWNGDGIMNFRAKKCMDDGNEEGKVGETFKLGSAFGGSIGLCANNQVSFNTGRNFFALAGYNFALGDVGSMKVTGSLMFDRAWDNPAAEQNNGNLDWALFLDPKINGVLDAELFFKAKRVGAAGTDKVSSFVTGAYFKPTMVQMLSDSTIGGSVVITDGTLMEFNVDWRAQVKPTKELMITYMGKFAKLADTGDDGAYSPCDGSSVGALAGLTGFNSSQVLWNMINARYTVNKTVTGVLALGSLTDLDDGFNNGRESADGTQIYVHPHAQIYASKGATVTAGVLLGFGGIGANADANKDVDILVNIPVLFRVKM